MTNEPKKPKAAIRKGLTEQQRDLEDKIDRITFHLRLHGQSHIPTFNAIANLARKAVV